MSADEGRVYDFEAVLTKYEKANLISTRIRELEANCHPLISPKAEETHYELAHRELEAGKLLHLSLSRPSVRGHNVVHMNEILETSNATNGTAHT